MTRLRRILPEIDRIVSWRVGRFLAKDAFWISPWNRRRLERAPRLQHRTCALLGRRIELTDAYWYLFCHHEIFEERIYEFTASHSAPFIIDCGANIGLSVIYFKYLYPDARIVAFEPDPNIFMVLQNNVREFSIGGVELVQKAVWNCEGEVLFRPDGSVGGRIVTEHKGVAMRVPTVRLRHLLTEPVDMLKIDIEGAEHEVLVDCRDVLGYAEHLFVEYHGKADEMQTLHELLLILKDAGFRYHVKEANPVRHPFLVCERDTYFDLQLNVYGFRS